MKKLLQIFAFSSLLTTTATNTIACKSDPKAELVLSDLPDVTNIRINDSKEDIELKILLKFLEANIYVSSYAYNLKLKNETSYSFVDADYIAKNGDELQLEMKDTKLYPYKNKQIIVEDNRINIKNFNLEFNQKITIKQFTKIIKATLTEQISVPFGPSDYQVYINDRDVTFSNSEEFISEHDDIKIKAWPWSDILYGEIIPQVFFEKVSLDNAMTLIINKVAQHLNYDAISNSLDELLPFWKEDVQIKIQRNGIQIEFDKNYIAYPQDVLTFTALNSSEWYQGSVSKVINKELYDDLFGGVVNVKAGTALANLKKDINQEILRTLARVSKTYKIDLDKIQFLEDVQESGLLTQDTTLTITLEDEFFTKPLSLKVTGADIFELALFKPEWKDYNTLIADLKVYLQSKPSLSYLDIDKDLLLTTINDVELDANFVPQTTIYTLIIVRGKANSLYTNPKDSYTSFFIKNN